MLFGCTTPHAEAQSNGFRLSEIANGMPEIYLVCDKDSLNYIRENFRQDIYIQASLRFQGTTWKQLKLRLRGDTSREFEKKSLKVKFPSDNRFVNGRKTLNLNADYLDATSMRQYLAARLYASSGQPCFRAEHLALFINNEFQGIYLLVESVSSQFLIDRNLDPNGALYKAKKDLACLNWQDDIDSTWERKGSVTENVWEPLKQLIKGLNSTSDSAYYQFAKQHLDYDNYINSIAMNLLIGNRSTYYHNYFVYQNPKTHKWSYLPWDMDQTFVRKRQEDAYGRGSNSDKRWATVPSNPLFERALNDSNIFSDIQRRVRFLSTAYFKPKSVFPIIDSLSNILRPYMLQDTFHPKTDAVDWATEIKQLKAYIRRRPASLSEQFAHAPRNFRLIQPSNPFKDQVKLSWNPSISPDKDGISYEVSYSSDPLFPEGNTIFHITNSTTYTLPVTPPPGKYFWRIYAFDDDYLVRGFDNVTTFEVVAP